MTPERWAEVQERLCEALEAPEAERSEFLARLEIENPAMALEVRSLLAAEADGALGPGTGDGNSPDGLVAEYVGPYRLIRRLGEGGMGIVFLAEREEAGFSQRVALKLLRSGFLDPRLADQVAHERRVLARLEHPNIARLIDGGTTPSGQPYLAMEYVEGDTLLDHAAQQGLSLGEKIGLFVEICDAVQYAHQQLVVHRDLKPRNVVVGRDGRPRLLDFGISKLLDPSEGDGGHTRSGSWFTAAYASPEQFQGRSAGTLTDGYALGMILYELLAGQRPYNLEGRSPAEMERLICEIEPPRPSERCADPRVARRLRGDLDTITLKALAKEPRHRYGSVEQLAEDLRRYLAGQPVRARRASVGYRTGKFIRRHRSSVAIAGVALAGLGAAVVGVARQAELARRERDRAEAALAQSQEVTEYLIGLFEAADPGQATIEPEAARALLRQGLMRVEELSAQPLVQAGMLDALGMVLVNLGQFGQAAELISRGWRLRSEALPADHPDVAVSLSHLGRVLRGQSRYSEALKRYDEALAIRLRALGPDHPDVAASHYDLGFLAPYLGQNDESVRHYEQALAIARRSLGEDHVRTADYMGVLGLALRRVGRLEEGLGLLQESLARKERVLGPDHPETALARFYLGDQLVRVGRPVEAERSYREGIAARRRVLGDDDLGMVHGLGNLASLLGDQGRGAEAEALYREALRIRRTRLGERSAGYAGSLDALASELARQGRLGEALSIRREALAILREALGFEHAIVAGSLTNLSELLERMGQLAEAERAARDAVGLRVRLVGPHHSLTGAAELRLASVLAARGQREAAEQTGRRGLAILEAAFPAGHPEVLAGHAALAAVLERIAKPQEAERHRSLASGGGASVRP